MRIGLGCTMIEPIVSKGQIDGVGFYTKHLLHELNHAQQTVLPFSFPPMKKCRAQSGIAHGQMLTLPYMAHTAISLATPRAFPCYSHLEKQIDIFHATDHLVPKLKKTPVIATLHDGLILTHPQWYASRFRHLKNSIRVKSLRWADHVITISQSMLKETVEFWGIKEEKISVVHNGITDWWFESVPDVQQKSVITKLGIPENFLLVVGTLQPKKNIPNIVQAYLKLPADIKQQYPLVIVGKAGWNTEESLAAIHTLLEQKAGYWLHYLPDEDVRGLFQATRLYLHPSLHEGFGLTILQAFASRVPVITSNITAMPEVAADAACLVDPYSCDEMTTAMQTLLTDETLCREYVQKGYERAKQFSWKKCADETVKIYQKILI